MNEIARLSGRKPVRIARPRLAAAPATPRSRYFAFLSYSHKDEELADWLHGELESFRVPAALAGKSAGRGQIPARLTPVFRDEHELAAASDLGSEIRAALASSQHLIVLCSPAAARSPWVNQEIAGFKKVRADGCILAVIGSGEPFASDIPGREDEECFPPALRERYDRRGRPTGKRAEPLAADLRGGPGERRIGFLKIVAGLLGVGLDELVQREATRRQRRLAWVTAASLVGMAIASLLAFAAVRARDEARDQRREAEGLVAFMVGDLKDKLEPIGKLDALDGVGRRVLAYYRKQDTKELTDAALLQRSRALGLTAQVAFLRGNFNQAYDLYRQATAGTAEAVERDPSDSARLFDHAQNMFWLGETARSLGRPDDALAYYRQYQQLGERLVALAPNNLKWRFERVYGNENVAVAYYNRRRFEEADRQLGLGLAQMTRLAAFDPTNQANQNELAGLIAWSADTKRALGKFDEAIALRRQELAIRDAAIARGATDVGIRQQLIVAHQALGNLFFAKGQFARSIAEFRTAVALADGLIPTEVDNALWKNFAAGAGLDLAKALLATGRTSEAAAEAHKACALAVAAPKKVGCLVVRTRLALARNDGAQAIGWIGRARTIAVEVHSDDPIRDRFALVQIDRLAGDARLASGDADGARGAWADALAALPSKVAEFPSELDERALVLERNGRRLEAARIGERLRAMNYRPSVR